MAVGMILLMCQASGVAAQGFVNPNIGTSFGAAVGELELEPRIHVGAVGGWLGPGLLGFELEVTHASDLYTLRHPSRSTLGIQLARGSRFTTVMGNVVFHPRFSGGVSLQPYVSGGIGLAVTNIDGAFPYHDFFDVNLKDPVVNVGGGVMHFFGRHLGMRADIRHVNVVSNRPERIGRSSHFTANDLALWRATFGGIVRFP